MEQVEVETEESATAGMSEAQKRLFNIRLKINQCRKANKEDAEKEFRNFKGLRPKKGDESIDSSVDGDLGADDKTSGKRHHKSKSRIVDALNVTAEDSAYWQAKQEEKEKNRQTFGWQSYTSDATYRAYNKNLKKLVPVADQEPNDTLQIIEENDKLVYGSAGTKVSDIALSRLQKDIEEKQQERLKLSRRRMHFDSTDVDFINDKNAKFNKRIKNAFDKYTVEIRQNLERGTAI